MNKILLGILIVCMLPAGAEAKQKLYKWVDKDGVTHYSAQPPVDQKVDTINISTGHPVPPPPTPERAKPPTQQGEAAANQAKSRKDPDKCKTVRDELEKLRIYPRVRVKDPDTGELRYLTEEEKAQRMERTKQQEKIFCE